MKLQFKEKETKLKQKRLRFDFRLDLVTHKNLDRIYNYYVKESKGLCKVSKSSIIKQLINLHAEELQQDKLGTSINIFSTKRWP